jgi:hypothetical protein
MSFKAVATIGLLLWSASAFSQKSKEYPDWPWVHAGSYSPPSQVHMSMWLNMESIHRVGEGVMDGWIKFKNDRPDQSGAVETLLYERLDCRRNWHSSVLLLKHDAEGRVVYEHKNKPEDMEPIEPETLLAGMMPFICAAGSMPQ